ncbi:uncharacterized protein LOC123559351 [Mercenaria mercenaria]|uniref:uncharacterized protein LOC123559351 n=1 Tax=Mercenaria mercenaria TaxID=6596 RepID=UPI00234E524D|nr:uncharacterized protein LOC123559351 [Mercenaria mercenaria]
MDIMDVSTGSTNRAWNKRAFLKYGMIGLAVTVIVITVAVVEAKRSSDFKDLLDKLPAEDTAADSSHQDVPWKGTYKLAGEFHNVYPNYTSAYDITYKSAQCTFKGLRDNIIIRFIMLMFHIIYIISVLKFNSTKHSMIYVMDM